jgi:glycosyltransferase involved in cell wall biosynthesis/tetratricopeptide (TPR) repeat protein
MLGSRVQYLFGPVSTAFGEQHVQRYREAGECLLFGHGQDTDVPLRKGDSWESLLARCPYGFRPDFIVLMLQYRIVPFWIFSAPVPIIALAGDWNLLWHLYRTCLPSCDLVLIDSLGVEALHREGTMHAVRASSLFGCERHFVEQMETTANRDIDVLFVGNFNPAVQSQRLEWLARLSSLSTRWNVLLATNVFGREYRQLLSRARIVFNRSIRGEANNRTFEAVASGAILFQETENRDVRQFFADGQECVYYDDHNLELLLDRYLENEEERCTIADNARRNASGLTFEALWEEHLALIARNWDAALEHSRQRQGALPPSVRYDVWQMASSASGEDSNLSSMLHREIERDPRNAACWSACGIVEACKTKPSVETIATCFQNAWTSDPRDLVAGTNLATALEQLGQHAFAIEQAERVLAMLDLNSEPCWRALDTVPYPATYDLFRVEWERVAWANAGNRLAEVASKAVLLRWQLHRLLARCTGDLIHDFEAVHLRPDMWIGQATLGSALLRNGKAKESLCHLRQALRVNPFDCHIAREYDRALELVGYSAEQLAFRCNRRLLAKAAPAIVRHETWFAPVQTPGSSERASKKFRILWQGTQDAVHSLAHVNRQICLELISRGHHVGLRPSPFAECADRQGVDLPTQIQERMGHDVGNPDVVVSLNWPPDFRPPIEGHWVIMQPWEYGSLPASWISPMTHEVDEVWVPSHFVRQCFISSGIPADQVHVVSLGIATNMFQQPEEPFVLEADDAYRFLFVGGTIERKGIDILLKTYAQVFSDRDHVLLVIKDAGMGSFYRGQTAETLIAEFQRRPHHPAILHLRHELTATEMAGLYTACDCLVHPFRAEGFGLPIVEAMASGRPVIVTGYGPTLDYCTPETAYLVPACEVPLDEDLDTVAAPFWAEPNQDMLRYYLRHVIENPDAARARGEAARTWIRDNFTWKHTVTTIEMRLHELTRKPIRRLHLGARNDE